MGAIGRGGSGGSRDGRGRGESKTEQAPARPRQVNVSLSEGLEAEATGNHGSTDQVCHDLPGQTKTVADKIDEIISADGRISGISRSSNCR